LKQDPSLVSPLAVIYYDFYSDITELDQKLLAESSKIQCLVAHNHWYEGSIDLGTAQFPKVDDYADGIDTMQFLSQI
jgi:hypothetical protein